MKQKTPQSILEMLQEIKSLSDQDKFHSSKFLINYPSFYQYRGILIRKGLFEKKLGREKWVGIEPNLVMAKAIIKLKTEHSRQLKEKRSIKKDELFDDYPFNDYPFNTNLIDNTFPITIVDDKDILISDKIEDTAYLVTSEKMKELIDSNSSLTQQLEELNKKENSELKLKLQNLKEKDEKISELKSVIIEAKKANDSLVNQLGKYQNQQFFDRDNLTSKNTYLNEKTNDLTLEIVKFRDENIKLRNELSNEKSLLNGLKNELRIKCDLLEEKEISSVSMEDLSNLNKKIYEQKQKILNLDKTLLEKDLMIENLKSISIVKSPNVTKKIKIFGIPIFSSETK
jgi:hypothetical protein